MDKKTLLKKYFNSDGAEFFGLATKSKNGLFFSIVKKSVFETIADSITGSLEAGSAGNGDRVRYSFNKTNSLLVENSATMIIKCEFTIADIETVFNEEKAKHLADEHYKSRNRGELFEDMIADQLGAERNNKKNESHHNGGDIRWNGMDIQVKYNRGPLAISVR